MSLPIQEILPQLQQTLLTRKAVVVQAPPGAGKSTLLPLVLLDQPWLGDRKILMLEPRRLAARLVARRLAANLGEPLGGRVGFRVRDERKVGRNTRLEVVTEGILTRALLDDPELGEVGAILFDEFHERSLQADLGLALALDVQRGLRPDLRLVVMSATLDGQAVAALLDDAPILTSDGRLHPVETRYLPPPPKAFADVAVAQAVRQALREEAGDVLVFLPGVREIRRTQSLLEQDGVPAGVDVVPLYGELPSEQQDRAVSPPQPGRRRIVLSTAIAETSLTIEGVRVVVDAGLSRRPAFDPRSGMSRLQTVRASLASADQRRGRAGRLAPGVCYRLWAEAENRARPRAERPEIEASDLAPLALDLALWGTPDPARLSWLTLPPSAHYAQAQALLRDLDAIDGDGRITAHGRRLAELPVHPRLAHMMVAGKEAGLGVTACRIAAALEDRDILRGGPGRRQADLRLRLDALSAAAARRPFVHGTLRSDERATARALRLAERWGRQLGVSAEDDDTGKAGLLVALAYPDRIARRRPSGEPRYVLSNGRGAALAADDALAGEPWLAIAETDGAAAESAIFLAAPVDPADLLAHFSAHIREVDMIEWDDRQETVMARRQRRLGAVVLRDQPLDRPSADQIAAALLQAVRKRGLSSLSLSPQAEELRRRVACVRRALDGSWPDFGDQALLDTLETWLGPFLSGVTSFAGLRAVDHEAALRSLLDWEQQRALDRLAPTHVGVPSGSRVRVHYDDPAKPVLAVKLQEMFGQTQTPNICDGRVVLTLHLLSPAGRPLQVTADLAGFWASSYQEVRREMRGRYPKHPWPEDPLAALPTARTKARTT